MNPYSWSHLADRSVLHKLSDQSSQHFSSTAVLLSLIAYVDQHRLYLPEAHASMASYCVHVLGMRPDPAYRRIGVARTAWRFPAIFPAIADGRLDLTAVLLLKPHLTPENSDELLAAAAHKTRTQIETLLAERYPRPDLPTLIQPVGSCAGSGAAQTLEGVASGTSAAPEPTDQLALERVSPIDTRKGPEPMVPLAPAPASPVVARPKLTPLSPGRVGIQFTVSERTHEKLRYAQALLGHAVPSGDVAEVFDRALDALIERLEKQKFAAASRTRPSRSAAKGRYVPAEIRRTVWQRDGAQCTFVSTHGVRCEERTRLEFDHIEEFARGGATTTSQLRLRCRAHNQYAAELTYGAEFMSRKRESARDKSRAKAASVNQEATASHATQPS